MNIKNGNYLFLFNDKWHKITISNYNKSTNSFQVITRENLLTKDGRVLYNCPHSWNDTESSYLVGCYKPERDLKHHFPEWL